MSENQTDHQHEAIAERRITQPWTRCVTPGDCEGHPYRAEAHEGNVVLDVCACGAVRESEHNNHRSNWDEWRNPVPVTQIRGDKQFPEDAIATPASVASSSQTEQPEQEPINLADLKPSKKK